VTAIILATCSHRARSGTYPEFEPSTLNLNLHPINQLLGDRPPEVEGEDSKFIYTKIGEMPSQFIQTCAGFGLDQQFNFVPTVSPLEVRT